MDLKNLVNEKKIKTESYLKLRRLTDSLFAGFSKLGLEENRAKARINLNSIKKKFKTVATVDTIKQVVAPRKKFFGRLADAIPIRGVRIVQLQLLKQVRMKGLSMKLQISIINYWTK